MKRKAVPGLILAIFFGIVFSFSANANFGISLGRDKIVNVNHSRPDRNSNRYLGTNQKKKKLKTNIRMVNSWECPSYLHYESKPQKKRQKAILKRRKKLM